MVSFARRVSRCTTTSIAATPCPVFQRSGTPGGLPELRTEAQKKSPANGAPAGAEVIMDVAVIALAGAQASLHRHRN